MKLIKQTTDNKIASSLKIFNYYFLHGWGAFGEKSQIAANYAADTAQSVTIVLASRTSVLSMAVSGRKAKQTCIAAPRTQIKLRTEHRPPYHTEHWTQNRTGTGTGSNYERVAVGWWVSWCGMTHLWRPPYSPIVHKSLRIQRTRNLCPWRAHRKPPWPVLPRPGDLYWLKLDFNFSQSRHYEWKIIVLESFSVLQ